MARRAGNLFLSRAFQRTLTALTKSAVRSGTKAVTKALRAKPVKLPKPSRPVKSVKRASVHSKTPRPVTAKPASSSAARERTGVAMTNTGPRRYRFFKPLGVLHDEKLPLLVMLHGCAQDAQGLSASSRMNRVAERERFLVMYPEQDRMANVQGCWNWYDTRTGRAQAEADSLDAAIRQICLTQPVDPDRIAVAGLSAGAGMAALLAMRHPTRFRAVAMHSGIAPGVAHSSASALSAMAGINIHASPAAALVAGVHLPALLVIQGNVDHVVAPSNGVEAVRLWADTEGAKPNAPRAVQRGTRYATQVTDYKASGRLVATLCEVKGLAHAWSGGASGKPYSDPKGPDASRMIWSFIAKQFATAKLSKVMSP